MPDPVTIGIIGSLALKHAAAPIAGLIAERKTRKELEALAEEGVGGQVSAAEQQQRIADTKEAMREQQGGEYEAPGSDDPEQKRKLAMMREAIKSKGIGQAMRDLGQEALQRYQIKKSDIERLGDKRKEAITGVVKGIGEAGAEISGFAGMKQTEGLAKAAGAASGLYGKG
tara:strand:+ start:8233 stop:8745 length:513 start_codon:yes stop_codon:yes gene_type:complete